MQGRYDLVFSDPPSHPSPPSTDTHDGQTEPATWNADTARTLFGVACAVAVFADAYHGGQSYIPAISAGLVLMLVPHWVLPTVRMKWVAGVALAGAVALDCFAPFYRTVPGAVHWKSAEAVHVRPWFPIFSNLILGFQYVLAGIFLSVQLRYEYTLHRRATLRRAKDLGIAPRRVRSALVPSLRLHLYPIFSACLLTLAVVPILYRQYASNVLALADDRFIGEALVSVSAVMAVAVSGAALKGDVRGWLGYHEIWQPVDPTYQSIQTPGVAEQVEAEAKGATESSNK